MRCFVLTSAQSPGIGEGLTYDTGEHTVQPGSLVTVPLRGKTVEGIVLSVGTPAEKEEYAVKAVSSVIGDTPLLSKAQMSLLRWMATYYACTRRQALRVFLPQPAWKNLVAQRVVEYVPAVAAGEPRGPKQKEVLAYARSKGYVSEAALKYSLKTSRTSVAAMVEQGYLERRERLAETPVRIDREEIVAPDLTPVQQQAYDAMTADTRPSLLFGVTGSGKTEIYAKMIAKTVNEGGQVILLVPEILLTEQSIGRFKKLLPRERLAMLHSRLLSGARRKEWKRIREGNVDLVIGSRSALFAPLPNLKLIIIDEEHEWTYKNEQTPRYHARETAEMLCRYAGAKLVMGTATPSIEAWSRAKNETYHLARVPERFMNRPVPTVRVIDLAEVNFKDLYPFSPTLLDEIHKRIEKKEQCVLFLNRRGMATAIMCMECRRRIVSPDSLLPYTLHRTPGGRPFLLDHISGATMDIPPGCPSCGSATLRSIGAGTQKLEDTLASVFPHARMIRADSDTLKFPEHMRELLRRMHEHEADILLGTQAVVKGLDLPGVTLAAVLVADVGLSLPHFRAGERVFQLLTQLAGRSGRAKPGEVIIQTFRPAAPEILAAASHATEAYLDQELQLRAAAGYPPLIPMIRLIFRDEDAGRRAAKAHSQLLIFIHDNNLSLKATMAPTLFGGGKEWHIIVRGKDARRILPMTEGIDCVVDVDPMETL